MKKPNTGKIISFAIVIIGYVVLQTMAANKILSASMRGMLVPICAYIVMAVSLNLTVGIMGELSLGHAGFMSIGAFTGTCAALMMAESVPNDGVRLAISMVIAAIFAESQ